MAQTGYTPILIYSSSTGGNSPAAGNLTNSTLGSELAINITDGKLFYKDNANAVQVIGWKTTPTTAGGTGLTSYTAGDLLYYASGTTLSKLAIGTSGQWLGSSGTAPQWNSPAALTKTDDTNVTLTLGGSASTALLNAASLTLGWTGQLAASRGGTGNGTYTAGDLLYASGTTTLSKLAIGTTNYVLTSSGSAPQWTAGSSVSVGTASNLLSNATTGVMQIVGPAASTTRVMTIPNANFTAARTDAAQTFTGINTFNSPVSATPETNGVVIVDTTGSNPATGSGGGLLFQQQNSGGTQSNYASIYGYRLNNAANDIVELAIATGSPGDSRPITKRMSFDTLGNITISNGNFVQGTASKGFNFTANSAAAGMTSQLLNWYEEGTWTPNQGAGLTVNGAFTSSGKYTRIGRQVTIYGYVNGATNVAVAAGGVICTNAPYTSSIFSQGSAANGTPAQGIVVSISSATVYAAAGITASNGIYFTITYFV